MWPISQEVKEALRKIAEKTTGWKVKDAHIKKIVISAFSKHGRREITYAICVGEELNPDISDTASEQVLAIFESNTYLVITPNRGIQGEMPYLFPTEKIIAIEREQAK